MNDMTDYMPGLERVRTRFLSMLEERQGRIAAHALAAWDAETVEGVNGNLAGARDILHQISGTAGALGFQDLGKNARDCEGAIIDHLEGPDADLAICPGNLISMLDSFNSDCRDLLAECRENIFADEPEDALAT